MRNRLAGCAAIVSGLVDILYAFPHFESARARDEIMR